MSAPAKEKALVMKPLETQLPQAPLWDYAVDTVSIKKDAVSDKSIKLPNLPNLISNSPGPALAAAKRRTSSL